MISILKITKGNNSAKNVGGVTVVNLCTPSDHALGGVTVVNLCKSSGHALYMLYICAKFHEIILNSIKVIKRTRFLYWKLQRGIIPQKM